MSEKLSQTELTNLTTQIVSSYVSANPVPADKLPELIKSVANTVARVGNGEAPTPEPEKPQPAVPIKKSIHPDYIVCLEDGKQLKMLKRYLRTNYNMTPDEYRAKWGLPSDYPMVAPRYAESRSQLAKNIGLGTKSRGRRGRK